MTQSRLFILDLGLFETRCGSVDWSEETIFDLLEIVVRANERVLACGRIPPLYDLARQGLVRYMVDEASPFHRRIDGPKEIFMSIPAILRDGGADCEDLSAWRVSELRSTGEKARRIRDQFALLKVLNPDGKLTYHVQVQRLTPAPSGVGWLRAGVEDPSALLGMGGPQDKADRRRLKL